MVPAIPVSASSRQQADTHNLLRRQSQPQHNRRPKRFDSSWHLLHRRNRRNPDSRIHPRSALRNMQMPNRIRNKTHCNPLRPIRRIRSPGFGAAGGFTGANTLHAGFATAPLPSPWSQQLWAGEPPSQPQELAQTVALKSTQSPSQSVEQQVASYSHTQSSQLTFACRTVTVAPAYWGGDRNRRHGSRIP